MGIYPEKIHIIEPCCTRAEHSRFNSGLIKNYLKQGNVVEYISTKEQADAIREIVKDDSVKYTVLKNVPKNEFLHSLIEIKKIVKNRKGRFIFSSINTFHLVALVFLRFIYRIEIEVIPHSILENSLQKNKLIDRLLFFRRFPFWLNLYLKLKIGNLILLSDSIYQEFKKNYKLKGSSAVYVLEHPYIYDDSNSNAKLFDKNNIKIGFIGVANKEKGYDWLVKELDVINLSENISFYLIGRNELGIKSDNVIEPFYNLGFIDENDYKSKIAEMDFFILPFPEDLYRLRASGTIFDSFSLRKPVICSDNLFCIQLLNKYNVKYIGFRKEDGLAEAMTKVGSITESTYVEYLESIESCLEELDK